MGKAASLQVDWSIGHVLEDDTTTAGGGGSLARHEGVVDGEDARDANADGSDNNLSHDD